MYIYIYIYPSALPRKFRHRAKNVAGCAFLLLSMTSQHVVSKGPAVAYQLSHVSYELLLLVFLLVVSVPQT